MSRTLIRPVHPSVAVPAGDSLLSAALGLLAGSVNRLLTWRGRARQRAALADLTDHMLADIGITRAQAMGEAAKPFWIP